MKYILLFLLFNFSLFSQCIYLLPDNYTDVIYKLEKNILKAKKRVFVLTDKFNNYRLKNALIKASKKGVKIELISAKEDMKGILEVYKNIHTKVLKAIDSPVKKGDITLSLIIIDNLLTCKLTTDLDTKTMQHDISIFTCKSDRKYTALIKKLIYPLELRSESYLK